MNPRLEAGYLFDDNYRLTQPGTEIDVQGPLVDAELEMRARSPNGEFAFTPRVRGTYFPDEKELDTIDYFATLDWQHRGQRVNTRVVGEFSQQDVVNSEQPDAEIPADADLGNGDIGDSGVSFFKNRRMRASVQPDFEYELSPRSRTRVRRQFHRRAIRQRAAGRAGRLPECQHLRWPGDAALAHEFADRAPARRAVRHRNAGRHELLWRASCNGTRATPPRHASTCASARPTWSWCRATRRSRGWPAAAPACCWGATSCSWICPATSARPAPASSSYATSCGSAGPST